VGKVSWRFSQSWPQYYRNIDSLQRAKIISQGRTGPQPRSGVGIVAQGGAAGGTLGNGRTESRALEGAKERCGSVGPAGLPGWCGRYPGFRPGLHPGLSSVGASRLSSPTQHNAVSERRIWLRVCCFSWQAAAAASRNYLEIIIMPGKGRRRKPARHRAGRWGLLCGGVWRTSLRCFPSRSGRQPACFLGAENGRDRSLPNRRITTL
jgi:hypothetical protein